MKLARSYWESIRHCGCPSCVADIAAYDARQEQLRMKRLTPIELYLETGKSFL